MKPDGTPAAIENGASCHDWRKVYDAGLCRWCYEADRAPARPLDPRPYVVLGAVQRAAARLPKACPHCHAPPPAWRLLGALASCWACGYDVFEWSGETISADAVLALMGTQDQQRRQLEAWEEET